MIAIPFTFRVDDKILPGQKNVLVVKVWSPFDKEILDNRQDRRTYMVLRNLSRVPTNTLTPLSSGM